MNSQVYLFDLDSGEETTYTLVFPQQADIDRRRISVLAPLGAALLGRRAGQIVTPITPNGRRRRLRIGPIVCEQAAVSAA
jgi:regulator of nucleoside diphosphate kinase